LPCFCPGIEPDGTVIAAGYPIRRSIWRFKRLEQIIPVASIWSLPAVDDVDASKTEVGSPGQKPLVIGIDFQQTVFGGTRQMQSVGRTREHFARQRCVKPP
jgi:hypothetical protein